MKIQRSSFLYFVALSIATSVGAVRVKAEEEGASLPEEAVRMTDDASRTEADLPVEAERPVIEEGDNASTDAVKAEGGKKRVKRGRQPEVAQKKAEAIEPAQTQTTVEPAKTQTTVEPAQTQTTVEIPQGAEVSTGARVDIDGKGFSINPPVGWIVQKNMPHASLVLMAPTSGQEYPRNISVLRFKGPKIIDSQTADAFAAKLVKDFPATSPSIENYTLRDQQSIQMTDGREGMLFYTDFLGSGRKMMQAHILLSSETNHYLVTYTDVAEHFEGANDGVSQFLSDAWAAMTSIQLDTPNPKPSRDLFYILGGIAIFVLAWMVFSYIRNLRAARQYREFSSGDTDFSSPDEVLGSGISGLKPTKIASIEPSFLDKSDISLSQTPSQLRRDRGAADSPDDKTMKFNATEDLNLNAFPADNLDFNSSDASLVDINAGRFKRGT